MDKDVHLALMMGPMLPLPAPSSVVEALVSAQVTVGTEGAGFQLTFAVSKNSPLMTSLLPAGYFDPMVTRVVIVVTVGGTPNTIMDGVITRHELNPSNEPGQSTLTITGSDLTLVMNLIEYQRPLPATDEALQVSELLLPFRALGVTPVVIPPRHVSFRAPSDHVPSLRGTPLDHIRMLADNCGYVFYLEPGPLPGQSIAYFGPDVRIPIPQPALSVNMDAESNVESLSVSLDGQAKEALVVTVLDPLTRKIPIPLPVPDVDILQPPLGRRPLPPAKIRMPDDMAAISDVPTLLNRVIGRQLGGSRRAITVSGTLDVAAYGRVLRPRWLVGMRGAGIAYDGFYYVDSVAHSIKRGEFKQSFQLSRDGLLATTPAVPV